MLHGLIDIPTLYYFQEKNIWTGSLFKEFNYKIFPIITDDKKQLCCRIWYGMICYDLVDRFEDELFEELSQEGLDKIISFINNSAEKYKLNY